MNNTDNKLKFNTLTTPQGDVVQVYLNGVRVAEFYGSTAMHFAGVMEQAYMDSLIINGRIPCKNTSFEGE